MPGYFKPSKKKKKKSWVILFTFYHIAFQSTARHLEWSSLGLLHVNTTLAFCCPSDNWMNLTAYESKVQSVDSSVPCPYRLSLWLLRCRSVLHYSPGKPTIVETFLIVKTFTEDLKRPGKCLSHAFFDFFTRLSTVLLHFFKVFNVEDALLFQKGQHPWYTISFHCDMFSGKLGQTNVSPSPPGYLWDLCRVNILFHIKSLEDYFII